jgi:hypothetical protein
MSRPDDVTRRGRRLALVIAGLGLAWIALTAAGSALGWSQRLRALFDLAVLAGFGWAVWQAVALWRRQQNRD